jgi:hypothetical protein
MLYPVENREEVDGGLSSGVVSRVRLGDCCVVYLRGCCSLSFVRAGCAYNLFLVRSRQSLSDLVVGWCVLLHAGLFSAVCPLWW